jgi:hypothetical protein
MGTSPDKRLATALIPIGAVALVAGCSGGSVNSNGSFVPQAASNRAMTTAQITVNLPARSGASGGKTALSIGNSGDPFGANQLGIRMVPSPAPAVTPTEQVFTLPTSGPVPTQTTLTVNTPVGPVTAYVVAYGPSPTPAAPPTQQSGSAARNALAASRTRQVAAIPFPSAAAAVDASVQNVTIAANGASSIPATLNPVAFSYTASLMSGQGYLSAAGNVSSSWWPLENVNFNQTVNISVSTFDVYGVPITQATPLGNSLVPASTAAGVSGPAVTTGGGTTTATYASASNSSGSLSFTPSAPGFAWGNSPSISVQPDYYVFISDGNASINVIDAATAQSIGVAGSPASKARAPQGVRKTATVNFLSSQIAATSFSGCSASGFVAGAFAVARQNLTVVLVPKPAGDGSFPTPTVPAPPSLWPWGNLDTVAIDSACNAYAGDDQGYLATASLSAATSLSSPTQKGLGPINAIFAASNTVYVAAGSGSLYSMPFGSSSPTAVSGWSSPGVPVSVLAEVGSNVFATYLTTAGYLQTVQLVPSGSTATIGVGGPVGSVDVMASSPSTLWMLPGNSGYLSAIPVSGSTLGSPVQTITALSLLNSGGIAVSKDAGGSTLWGFTSDGNVTSFVISGTSVSPTSVATPVSSTGGIAIAP